MHRRQFIASALATAALPRLAGAHTPAASPAPDMEFVPVEVDGHPLALSPDGTMIAGTTGNDEIGIWDARSFELIAQSDPMDEIPLIDRNALTWAPDSTAIAFWPNTIAYFLDSDIYTFEIASATLTNLTNEQGQFGATPMAGTNQASIDSPMHMDTFPTWSPDSNRIAFSRSTHRESDKDMGTDLCTVPREGGEIKVLATLSEVDPYLVSSTMFWDPDGSIIYATQPFSSDPADNGLFQVLNDGSINAISQGLLAAGMPMPMLFDVAPAAGLASVMSARNYALRHEADAPGTYFLVDLSTGIPTRFEDVLSLPIDFDDASRQGLVLDSAPAIVTGTAGADPRFLYITTDYDTFRLYLQPMEGGDRVELGAFPEPDDDDYPFRMPHIEVAENGTVLAMPWKGTWIAHNVV